MNIFKSLTDKELKKAKTLSKKEIIKSLAKGRKDADAYLKSCSMLNGRFV